MVTEKIDADKNAAEKRVTSDSLQKRREDFSKVEYFASFFKRHQGEGHDLIPYDDPRASLCGYVCDCGVIAEMSFAELKREMNLDPEIKMERILMNKGW